MKGLLLELGLPAFSTQQATACAVGMVVGGSWCLADAFIAWQPALLSLACFPSAVVL